MPTQDPEEAAARRAARKKARLKTPPPELDERFAGLSLAQLRAMRDALSEEETRVSYWRRIVQARIDLLRAHGGASPDAEMGPRLADARSSHRRLAHISVEPVDGLPPIPDLERLWATEIDPDDAAARDRLEAELQSAEATLSEYRTELFGRIDRVTGELIARYREDPSLALSVLPGRADPGGKPTAGRNG